MLVLWVENFSSCAIYCGYRRTEELQAILDSGQSLKEGKLFTNYAMF
ncbi:hypothetical protein LINPERPRIM_LOCUS25261 [Linum perenne]